MTEWAKPVQRYFCRVIGDQCDRDRRASDFDRPRESPDLRGQTRAGVWDRAGAREDSLSFGMNGVVAEPMRLPYER